jgi:hypothetical protein
MEKGSHMTEEQKKRVRAGIKNPSRHWLGKHRAQTTLEAMRPTMFKKNGEPWNKGTGTKGHGAEHFRRMRQAVLDLLGGKCAGCGIDDPRILQVDHLNGDGHHERKHFSPSVRQKMVLESFSRGEKRYQLLCANCNWIKRVENHETKKLKQNG